MDEPKHAAVPEANRRVPGLREARLELGEAGVGQVVE
jgi:hypothetical protein